MLRYLTKFLRCLPLMTALAAFSAPAAHAEPPVKIYILAGQSNMQGKGAIEGDGANSLRSLVNGEAKQEFQFLVDDKGEWVEHKDVWAHYDLAPFQGMRHGPLKPGFGSSGGQIGPELGFGHVIADTNEGKVLLIKAAWGGKSLGENFLPPSVGKYPMPKDPNDPGFFYHRTLELVSEVSDNIETLFPDYKGQGVEIAGFGWHQGWNDQYGGLDAKYEANMAAFIKDIRSVEHGLGVPGLPFVIVTSGNIGGESVIKQSQLAMADTKKHPDFAGNVAVVDTDKPYGPKQMVFKFNKDGKPADTVGYHWDSNARAYLNMGRAMAMEMEKLKQPKSPARFRAFGTNKGVQLNWQLGTEKPKGVEILRNGKKLDAKLSPSQTAFLDSSALPGANSYELILDMPSGKVKFNDSCHTSVTALDGYHLLDGMVLSWEANGRYEGFRLSRDGKVIADDIAGDARSFKDTEAPAKGKISYAILPKRGETTPAQLKINLGPITAADAGGALVYEPFNYPASHDELQYLTGKGGALGTTGTYVYLSEQNPERAPAVLAKGLSFGALPVNGNRGSTHGWSAVAYIELDDSLQKAGLLEDGATLWMSYLLTKEIFPGQEYHKRDGAGTFTLRTEDMQQGVGFESNGRQYETAVVLDGKIHNRRITNIRGNGTTLVLARITWGQGGENDSFVPFTKIGPDLKLPEKEGRHSVPFNIDQTKLSRLVLSGGGQFDEIRIGPTFESVIGGGK